VENSPRLGCLARASPARHPNNPTIKPPFAPGNQDLRAHRDVAVIFAANPLVKGIFRGHGDIVRGGSGVAHDERCKTLRVATRFRLQSNPLSGKLTTKYFLPLGTRQVGDDVVFFNFGYEEAPP